MSVWASINGPDVLALNGDDEAANSRAEGEPSIEIDVATNGFHPLIRLALWSMNTRGELTFDIDISALLSPAAVRVLRDKLNAALGET